MSKRTDFTEYKETIIFKLIENDNIVQALVNNKPNFLEERIDVDPTSLVYSHIFPIGNRLKHLQSLHLL